MSRSADIDLTFQHPATVTGVLSVLAGHGWGLVEPLGVSYMLEGDDDWGWTSVGPEQAAEVVAMLDSDEVRGQVVAVVLYHPQAGAGGHLLLSRDRTTAGFSPVVDRRKVPGAPEMTDMAWYVQNLVYPLIGRGRLLGYELRDMAD